ncbi:unnamed protein product [Rhizophagus irregularis]|nr:unnamed protein product [Rhizophagus irregularis]
MRRLIIKLEVTEIKDGKINYKEENIKEIEVFETEWIEYYESMKENNDIMRKLDMVYGMIDIYEEFRKRHGNITLCYGCMMPINKNEEKKRCEERNKLFTGNCLECSEQEELTLESISLFDEDELESSEQDEYMETDEADGDENNDNDIEEGNSNEYNNRKGSNKRKRRIEKEANNTEKGNERKKAKIEGEESTEEEEMLEDGTEAFKKLLKDLCTPVIEEQVVEQEDVENMTLERLFTRAEKGSQELVKYWFDVGKEFRNEIKKIKGETNKKEKTIRSDIYNRMEKNLKGRTRNTIQARLTRAENIYKLFEGIGGKQKINRMKNTCMNTIIKLKFREGEIDELIRKVNEIEEERNSIMEE